MTGSGDGGNRLERLLDEDPADLYENAPMGYLSTLPDGRVVKANRTFCAWTGRAPEDLLDHRFQDLLSVGGRVFYNTHLLPLLRLQGMVREIAIDITRIDGSLLPCLLNAVEVRDEDGAPLLVRATLFEATARRRYERELLAAQRLAEESEARSRVVQKVVFDLAAAATPEDVATVIVQRGRAALRATGAALVLVEGEPDAQELPALRPVRSEGVSRELLRRLRDAAGSRLALELAQGLRSILLDARLRADQPELAATMAADGLTDLVVVPVSADSKRLGVLVLARGAPARGDLISLQEPGEHRPLTPAEVDLLWTLGRQAGQALERVRLHEQTRQQGERAAFLLEAARLMSEARDVTETVHRLAGLVVSRLADVCVIDMVTEHGLHQPVARHRDPDRQAVLDRLRGSHPPARSPMHPSVRALREGRTQWIRDLEEARAVLDAVAPDDAFREAVGHLELVGVVGVPMIVDGRRLGVVTFGADRHRAPFTAADVEVAEQLALQLSQVVDKALRLEFEERTSHTLQASLLPPSPPVIPGLTTAVRYLAATRGVDVGGDFYDVVRLPGDQVGLTVGDVVGHDITAAATMGQLRSVTRAMSADRPSPAVLVDRLQHNWELFELQRMATALFATLDPASGELRLASAGHLPPLLCTQGRAELLPVRPTRMLGAPPAPAVEWSGALPEGAALLLFTDGLVESPGADLDAGLARLVEVAARAWTGDPEQLCDRLLSELTGEHRADDIALLALTRS
ncbi:SpoIIE family protein phosphatase [Blastococcus sp. BMG 814]|uniref:SpoIIE family protein phosphatase n=1 Tax=Blastococcus carthaginiensis TaxID=3050034 RepID=A0ABT9IDA0_9ACTN|nr:SpoIIE family protein phosphatase [Blastococcus carthaginiensis]MDP5183553.1 SpoIIE family protein phosphatase [Blastococcus carthaginiensis]